MGVCIDVNNNNNCVGGLTFDLLDVRLLECPAMSVATRREQPQAATYSKRLKDSIKSILDNYGEILKASKVSLHHRKAGLGCRYKIMPST